MEAAWDLAMMVMEDGGTWTLMFGASGGDACLGSGNPSPNRAPECGVAWMIEVLQVGRYDLVSSIRRVRRTRTKAQ